MKSLMFVAPFGTHVSTSYSAMAQALVEHSPQTTLWRLPTTSSLLYAPGEFERRGCLWWDGEVCGATFVHPLATQPFFPAFKSRYRGVPPFVLYGYAGATTPESFVVCDLCVWRGRGLRGVPLDVREGLLRALLATLVDNQPVRFLQEQRLRVAAYQPLPRSLHARKHLLNSGADLYVVGKDAPHWRVWCPFWVDQ